jgi:hypothetical protein
MKLGYEEMLARLKRKASKSPCKYRVGALGLDFRNKPILVAFNSQRFSRKGGGLHSEMALMKKAPKSLRTIIICRIGMGGILLPIDPCPACSRKAEKLGIKIISI